MDNTLQLNQQGGGRIDIPLPKPSTGLSIIELSDDTGDIFINNANLNVIPIPARSDYGASYTVSTFTRTTSAKYINPQNVYSDSNTINLLKNINSVTSEKQIRLITLNQTGTQFYINNSIHVTQDATTVTDIVFPDGNYIGTFVLIDGNAVISEIISEDMQTMISFNIENGTAHIPAIDVWIDSNRLVSKSSERTAIERMVIPLNRIIKVA